MKKPLLFLSLLALSGGVSAEGSKGAAAKDKDKEPVRVYCTMERVTGSHLPKRVCMTEEQREQRAREDQEAARRIQSPAGGPSPAQSGGTR